MVKAKITGAEGDPALTLDFKDTYTYFPNNASLSDSSTPWRLFSPISSPLSLSQNLSNHQVSFSYHSYLFMHQNHPFHFLPILSLFLLMAYAFPIWGPFIIRYEQTQYDTIEDHFIIEDHFSRCSGIEMMLFGHGDISLLNGETSF